MTPLAAFLLGCLAGSWVGSFAVVAIQWYRRRVSERTLIRDLDRRSERIAWEQDARRSYRNDPRGGR